MFSVNFGQKTFLDVGQMVRRVVEVETFLIS